jgi:uncharacterized protein (DUF2237 family)
VVRVCALALAPWALAACEVALAPKPGAGPGASNHASRAAAPVSAFAACAPSSASLTSAGGDRCLGSAGGEERAGSRSVLGGALIACPSRHAAGFYRDGYCHTGADDHGVHVVCARVTDAFLAFSRSRGNDLVTPRGAFPGLKEGDGWCLCAARWQEAHEAGVAPPVVLAATHEAALRTIRLEDLQRREAR